MLHKMGKLATNIDESRNMSEINLLDYINNVSVDDSEISNEIEIIINELYRELGGNE